MFILIAENEYGEQLELTNNPAYVIKSIAGLDPPDATINTTKNAGEDGSKYNSGSVGNRTLTLTVAINSPAEPNRIALYTYFKTKKKTRIYYSNDTRDVYIDGYVQRMTVGFFEKKQVAQIVILCPQPFFNAIDENIVDFSSTTAGFEFPFSLPAEGAAFSTITLDDNKNIINGGDVESGFVIKLAAFGDVVNPQIYNMQTNEFFKLTITLADGDEVTIDTRKKQKSVTLTSGGVTSNIIGHLDQGSTWLSLNPGDNIFLVTATTTPENMIVTAIERDQFEGV